MGMPASSSRDEATMTIALEHIETTVRGYIDRYPSEGAALAAILETLAKGFDFTSRRRYPAHVTAGIVLVDEQDRVLQIKHGVLGRWLTPGGHCEPEDKSLAGAALRELAEECGVGAEDVERIGGDEALPVHIGVHGIPANDARSEPMHHHFDFRYAFRMLPGATVRLGHEASDLRWTPYAELAAADLADHELPKD
ncbi:NUDIX hydrolase [Actinospica sp.]|jgi:8-oxo-dGTP pyrophosphatase MutT (NUDIX family)|uniref:NUDIX hydrolase n=1 Tax=Actinospica sp. TaxID=1872142 RepID=UPI002C628145|nr:NUDIX domain-containing protein [Actinospica sp.]HWG25517.1 NUDIX domain-containing protein [Actinospica sp.]